MMERAQFLYPGELGNYSIQENQGKSVKVCAKPGNLSVNNCHTYETTGSDSVSIVTCRIINKL